MDSELALVESTIIFGVGWPPLAMAYIGVGGRVRTKSE
jgi:hypothetical protein